MTSAAGTERTVVHWNSHFYPVVGGIPTHIDSLCSNITSFRHVIATNLLRGVPRREKFRSNTDIIRFGPRDLLRDPPAWMSRKLVLPLASGADVVRAYRQRRFFRCVGRPIVHVHDVEWNLVQLDAASGMNVGERVFRSLYSPVEGCPALLTKHFLFPPHASAKLRHAERELTLRFPTIICVDRKIEQTVSGWAAESGIQRNVRFIPNSIDTDLFRQKPLPPFTRLRVGFVARLDAVRGVAFLREFLSSLPDFVEFHGALATSPERFEEFRREFVSDSISLRRNVPQELIPDFLSGIHVLVNPVTVDYGVGRSTLEAMACGRCVVMFGSHPRPPLYQGDTGVFTPPTRDAVVQALRSLFESPRLVEDIGSRARRAVEAEFSNAKVLPAISQIYEDLWDGSSGS